MILSILICSLRKRADLLGRVINQLNPQIKNSKLEDEVEVITYVDEGQMTIGDKRNELKRRANGKWLCYVDDDDHVNDSYVCLVVEALKRSDPDCIGLVGKILWKGTWSRFEHSIRHPGYATLPGPVFVRPPNHLNPIRTEIAREIQFPPLDRSEDTAYSLALQKSGLIKTETFIEAVLYFYTPSRASDREKPKPKKRRR